MKKNLRKVWKRFDNIIDDVIIYGSFVKSKDKPKDIDVALISGKKDYVIMGEFKSAIPEKIHLEFFTYEKLYETSIGLSIISEGFSIKHNKFLKEMSGANPMKVYSWEIKKLKPSEKRQFNRALKDILKRFKGTKLGAGTAFIPAEQSGAFEDFLKVWEIKKTKIKKYNILLF